MTKNTLRNSLVLVALWISAFESGSAWSACNTAWRSDSTYPAGSEAWTVNLPGLDQIQTVVCRVDFNSVGYLSSARCYNSKDGKISGTAKDYATPKLSDAMGQGWPVSLSGDCKMAVTIPFKKAGNVEMNATINGSFMSGNYLSKNHPEGVSFVGSRVVPLK